MLAWLYSYGFRLHTIGTFHATRLAIRERPPAGPLAMAYRARAVEVLRIEHHWQYLYRWSHFRGATIMGALSAIDIALWDIAGKHFGVPCYQLMGGTCREKARVYAHVFGGTMEELLQGCRDARQKGFTAIGHLTPFLDEPRTVPYFKPHASKIRDAIDTVRRYREAVGNEVDLCIEIHWRLTPAEAMRKATSQIRAAGKKMMDDVMASTSVTPLLLDSAHVFLAHVKRI